MAFSFCTQSTTTPDVHRQDSAAAGTGRRGQRGKNPKFSISCCWNHCIRQAASVELNRQNPYDRSRMAPWNKGIGGCKRLRILPGFTMPCVFAGFSMLTSGL